MKIFTTRGVIASGQALEAGSVYDVSEKDASTLIAMGKAREATAEDEAPACPPTPPAAKPKAKKVKPILEVVEDGTE
tara:strand:+ start:2464 stop:2694 length:231 start_codon:yes stop_codon:yes gene_type:complete